VDLAASLTLGIAVVAGLGFLIPAAPAGRRPTASRTPFRLTAGAALLAATVVGSAFLAGPGAAVTPPPFTRLGRAVSTLRTLPAASLHVVARGDTLWDIAAGVLARRLGRHPTRAEIARFWPRIYRLNRAVIGADPGLIRPGERLRLPKGSP